LFFIKHLADRALIEYCYFALGFKDDTKMLQTRLPFFQKAQGLSIIGSKKIVLLSCIVLK
jgi:hypothetical protein